ncbi:hypothetical protein LS68_000055 [Helicobacter sp. MIT 05-5293]|uniref:hypothetical protein n=1 Tax=Helicobacter sp. MIT 05-5293 TaxID=1548149 RepID=UPI00051D44D5|nr:hypothetical protein [Helicobacter sp. MIT 05-5293]TLD81475.1 hypothetical protein LS68_000055 [Helicobacter sp. MIT 05-5293]
MDKSISNEVFRPFAKKDFEILWRDKGNFLVGFGFHAKDECFRLGLRYTKQGRQKDFPTNTRNEPCWFIVPDELAIKFLQASIQNDDSRLKFSKALEKIKAQFENLQALKNQTLIKEK